MPKCSVLIIEDEKNIQTFMGESAQTPRLPCPVCGYGDAGPGDDPLPVSGYHPS